MAGQKFTSDKKRTDSFFQKHWWKIGISLLFITAVVFFGYNKYLDQQNVSNMEQLLADFEKLKSDVEAETGEKLYIEATCGNVGKFATSYACTVTLRPVDKSSDDSLVKSLRKNVSTFLSDNKCILASEGFKLETPANDYFICSGFSIRPSNTNAVESLFYKYDTSPGSAI